METGGRASSPDKSDARPSFRKPLNDAVNRKYRRHSPDGGGRSDSSPSHGSPKLERSHSPPITKEVHSKSTDGQQGRDVERQLDRDVSRNRSSRGHDSHRYTERQSHRSSYDFQRHGDHGRHHRRTDDDDSYQRSYRLGRESKNGDHIEYSKNDRVSDRSRDNWRTDSSRSENVDSRSRNYGRENVSKDYHKFDDRGRQANTSRGSDRTNERDYHKDNDHYGDRKDHHKNPGNHRNDCRDEEMSGYGKGSSRGRDAGTHHLKETGSTNTKAYHDQEDQVQKRKRNEWESRSKDKYPMEQEEEINTEKKSLFDCRERDEKNQHVDKISNWSDGPDPSSTRLKFESAADEKPSFGQQAEVKEKVNAKNVSLINNDSGATNSVDAAKVAALKAAELVNRNLVGAGGVGYLSTDQKKKLLWGSKKNNAAEESSNHWDLNLFSDKERQDKFNKLMSLRLPWPLVLGCERRCCSGEQTRSAEGGWRCPGQETRRAGDGLGETVHGRAEAKRRSHSWSRLVRRPAFSSSQFRCMNRNVDKTSHASFWLWKNFMCYLKLFGTTVNGEMVRCK